MTRTFVSLTFAASILALSGAAAGGPAAQDAAAGQSRAAAREPAGFTAASAVRLDDGRVELKVTWDGGACEEPGEVEVTAGDEITDEVTIPTISTAEVCTMQIVPVEFTGVIAVEPPTTTLAVIVLDPDGQPKAAGSVEIE